MRSPIIDIIAGFVLFIIVIVPAFIVIYEIMEEKCLKR